MRKIVLPFLFSVFVFAADAQTPQSVLNQNFDVACVAPNVYPGGWLIINPVLGTFPDGAWHCTTTSGETGTAGVTPGVMCSGYWNGAYHLDTSFLITPLMSIGQNPGKTVYLQFDSKSTAAVPGGKLSLDVIHDTAVNTRPVEYSDITDGVAPVIDNIASADWISHEVDITSLKSDGNFYLAFRYTSTDTSGNVWLLDNVRTSPHSIKEQAVSIANAALPLTVIGLSTPSRIRLSFSAPDAGVYNAAVYDITGRQLFNENFQCRRGEYTHDIKNLDIAPGMYFVRVHNERVYGTAKVSIQ
jgi:hypothetical protein